MSKIILLFATGVLLLLLFLYHDTFYLFPLFILIILFILQNINFKYKIKNNLVKLNKKHIFLFGFLIFFTTLVTIILFNLKKINTKTISSQKKQICEEGLTLKKAKLCTFLILRDDDSHGSGFSVIDKYIITNKHVIEGANKLYTKINGEEVGLKVWNYSPSYDIAVLKIEKNIPTCEWFDSKLLNPAESLYAIGWPLENTGDSTISKGIFSRYYEFNSINYIQTDTPINPGNSGGPLLNKCGVVGINTVKIAAAGIEGMGFALPSSDLISLVNRLIADGGEDTEIPIAIESGNNESATNNYVVPNNAYIINIDDVKSYLNQIYGLRESWKNYLGSNSNEDGKKLIDSFNRQIDFCETLIKRLSERNTTQDDIAMWDSVVKMSYESSSLTNKLNGR